MIYMTPSRFFPLIIDHLTPIRATAPPQRAALPLVEFASLSIGGHRGQGQRDVMFSGFFARYLEQRTADALRCIARQYENVPDFKGLNVPDRRKHCDWPRAADSEQSHPAWRGSARLNVSTKPYPQIPQNVADAHELGVMGENALADDLPGQRGESGAYFDDFNGRGSQLYNSLSLGGAETQGCLDRH